MRTISFIWLSLMFFLGDGAPAQEKRECVRDRISHVQEGVIAEVPDVRRLCDGLDLEKKRISVGDCALYCEVEGRGMPMVLINGGPGGTHHYFHPYFSRAVSFARVIYYDQRGCGLSDFEAGAGYSVSQAVDDLDQLRRALGVERWLVLGCSYGGLLAQRYTLKYPQAVAGLVLVGASTSMDINTGGSRQYDFMSTEEIAKVRETYENRSLTQEVRLFNAHYFGDWKRQSYYRPTREKLARMVKYEWKHAADFRQEIFRNDYEKDLQGAFTTCPIPTLLMEGKWDLTWGKEKAKNFHKQHPGAQLLVFEQSAHSPFEDEPDKFFTALEKFVKNLTFTSPSAVAAWKKQIVDWQQKKVVLQPQPAGKLEMTDSNSLTCGVLHCTQDPQTGILDLFLSNPMQKSRRNLTMGRLATYRQEGWITPWGVKGSPDGKSVAFRQYRKQVGQKIWILDMVNNELRQVPGTYDCGSLAWSSDSSTVGFTCSGKDGLRVFLVDRKSLESCALVGFEGLEKNNLRSINWSPDNQWLACMIGPIHDQYSLRLIAAENGKVKTLMSDFDGCHSGVCWSPDSQALALVINGRLSIVSLNGKMRREFGEASNVDDWSSDGKFLVYETQTKTRHLWILSLEDGSVKPVDIAGDAYGGRWSPTGNDLVFWCRQGLVFLGQDETVPMIFGDNYRGSNTEASWLWRGE